jgi:hypothetical protein
VGYGSFKGVVVGVDSGIVVLRALFGEQFSPSSTVVDQFGSLGNSATTSAEGTRIVITSVTRIDGQPDTCGNPPGGGTGYQPGDNIYNDNVTYVNENNTTVNAPVTLAFGYATLNVNGTVSIPVNAKFSLSPQFNTNLNFNLNTGDITPDFSNPSAPLPSPCTDPGGYKPDPSIPLPPSSIPDADPLPNPDSNPTQRQRLIKGCIVTTTFLDGNETTIDQQENPTIYVPATGYVQFLIQVGGSSAWTNDIPVKSLRAFIPCPWDGGALDVKGYSCLCHPYIQPDVPPRILIQVSIQSPFNPNQV